MHQNMCFVCMQGECGVYKEEPGVQQTCIHTLHGGHVFGEVALLEGKQLAETLIAHSTSVLLLMPAHDWLSIMAGGMSAAIASKWNFLRSLHQFDGISDANLRSKMLPALQVCCWHHFLRSQSAVTKSV
jgi:CRP-like cAMP-binding protein